jgi:hypothetical protein
VIRQMMTDLLPATQAIIDASNCAGSRIVQLHIADALRAAADQVVPEEIDLPPIAPDLGHFRQHERRLTRRQLLAIAAELEGQ